MSGLDATFLYAETPTMHMHVCAGIVFDPSTVPGGYSFEGVKEVFRSRLHLAAPLRRRLANVPFNLDHPVWVEDPDFDLDYHVRRIGCPAPGTEEQFAEIVGDIAGRPLDRSRPLWELWVVEGLDGGLVGLAAKMHHCTIDGVSGANLLVHFLDLTPEGSERAPADPSWEPERVPSDIELIGRALFERLRRPLRTVPIIARTAQSLVNLALARRRGEGPGMAAPLTAPRTSFNGAITPHRNVAFGRVPLDDIKAIRKAFDAKVNDVVLCVAAGALRRYLQQRGELPDKSLIATVPVSVHSEEEDTKPGINKVSAMFCRLRTDIEDPVERLREIAKSNAGAKRDHNAIGAGMLQQWATLAAPNTFSMAVRFYSSLRLAEKHPVIHNLVISNVPGPRFPLYIAGAKLVAMYPLGPVFHGAALNITVLSYMDDVFWGLIAGREAVPDLWALTAAIPDALAELRKAADGTG